MRFLPAAWATALIALSSCGNSLPEHIADYAERCSAMNMALLPPRDDDPHSGRKNVFACEVADPALRANTRPFPEGTWIIKEAFADGEDFPWLVATAEKRSGTWRWHEYTRNFASEALTEILPPESTCVDCHRRVASADYIFTVFETANDEAAGD